MNSMPRPAAKKNPAIPKIGPEAVMFFLKQAALDRQWGTVEIRRTLGVNVGTAREVASELQLMGYSEQVPKKSGAWRNTKAGNLVAGVRPARLTRQTAEELLTDLADRAEAINLSNDYSVRIRKIVAYGGITTKHERIQDIDIGVQLEAKEGGTISKADQKSVLAALKGKSRLLKLHIVDGWLAKLPGRTVWEG